MVAVMFKLEQLRHFLAAANFEHIHRAAESIPISPSAISHSINQLETSLGCKLFRKVGRRIVLTESGKLLQQKAQHLLCEADAVAHAVSRNETELSGYFRLAGTHCFVERFLLQPWLGLQKKHMSLTGEVLSLRSAEVIERVAKGEIDVGLCLSPHASPVFDQAIVQTGRLLIVVRRGHPVLRLKGAKRLAALSQYPASFGKSYEVISSCEIHPELERYNLKPKIQLSYDSYSVAVSAIKHSDSWSLLPEWVVDQRELHVIEPKQWQAEYQVALIWQKHLSSSRLLAELRERVARGFT